MIITAREILNNTVAELELKLLKGVKYLVQYDDGVSLGEHKQAIILNRYCWELFKLFPNNSISSNCSSITVIGKGYYTANVPVKMLENIFNHICEEQNIIRYNDKEALLKSSYKVINTIFNEIVQGKTEYCTTIDAVDFVKVVNSPAIKQIHENLQPTPDSVENAYRGIRQYINSETEERNHFVNAYRCKATNDNQSNQCIGPRGFVTRLDRTVLPTPIMNGFIRGMGSLYEIIAESLTAVKALNASDSQIQISEYASRRIQLVGMAVTTVDMNDCGSQEYFPIILTEKYLPNLKGIWYCTETDKTLRCFKGNERDLLDRQVLLRTAFGCKSKDPQQVCYKCLGQLSTNFKENSNIGYTTVSHLMEKLTQAILSTKHLTHSARPTPIKLVGEATRFFYTNENNDILLHSNIDVDNTFIILPINRVSKLVDVLNLNHTNVALNKVGDLEEVFVLSNTPRGQTKHAANISYKDRMSNITRDFLFHIRNAKVEVDAKGNYVIPMAGFNTNLPLFNNQMKETNIVSFVNKIASIIEVTGKNKMELNEHFANFCDVVFDQFNCNLTVLQSIIYATTAYNPRENNFRLGRNSPHSRQVNKSLLFRSRSASQLLVFEGAKTAILKHPTYLFTDKNRMDHPMDVLFEPAKVVQKYARENRV